MSTPPNGDSAVQPVTLQLRGHSVETAEIPKILVGDHFQIEKYYELGSAARSAGSSHAEELEDEVVGFVTYEDMEWYGIGDELPEVTGSSHQHNRGLSDEIVFPLSLNGPGTRGGTRGLVINKFFKIAKRIVDGIKNDTVAAAGEQVAQRLGKSIDDRQCSRPGLIQIDANGGLIAGGGNSPKVATNRKVLLLIHGTISNFQGGFADIPPRVWQRLHTQYKGQIFAFNHPTITVSPVANALKLLEALPSGITVDILAHSRGGLVADVLARCDSRLQDRRGYDTQELKALLKQLAPKQQVQSGEFSKFGETNPFFKEFLVLNEKCRAQSIIVERIVRVGCPAEGTTLLSKRLDHYLNALFNVTKLAGGPLVSGLVDLLRTFVIAVIDERSDASSFPGLYCMVPDSGFVKINNHSLLELPSEVVNVAGNGEIGSGNLLFSLKVVLSNLYYWQENDFVVDTASMSRGHFQRAKNTTLSLANSEVDHFSYFKVAKTLGYIIDLLINGQLTSSGSLPKGTTYGDTIHDHTNQDNLLDKLLDLGTITPATPSGTQPIVVLLPGIMGSNLYCNNDLKWLRLSALAEGALVDDLSGTDDVQAKSIIARYYEDLTHFLVKKGYDVVVHPFDWRLSLKTSVTDFAAKMEDLRQYNQPVSIIAHSMGGLLVRQWMIQYETAWQQFRDDQSSRLILLGTPWRGSHLITEVLTGYAKRVSQLHRIDLKHSKREILDSLVQHEGIFELLPLDDNKLIDEEEWELLQTIIGGKDMAPIPPAMIAHFASYRKDIKAALANFTDADWAKIIYVAGKDENTIDGVEISHSNFLRKRKVRFIATPRGDGSVTWKKGIPAKLPKKKNVYYVNTSHMNLAADEKLFPGLLDLLRGGSTQRSAFARNPAADGKRSSASRHTRGLMPAKAAIAKVSPLAALMRESDRSGNNAGTKITINVEVFNGDLKWAQFPVLVGHFEHDGIVSAERAIDRYLGGILNERHLMGFYPGKIGEQEIIIDEKQRPRGTIVVGLGDKDELSGFSLAKTVEKGLLKYAMFHRDNQIKRAEGPATSLGVSTLFIGSSYGQLPLRESLRSVLLGVRQANEIIMNFNKFEGKLGALLPITDVEFVDYYEDRAYEAYKSLKDLVELQVIPNLNLAPEIIPGFGHRKRFIRDESSSWWQTFTTVTIPETVIDGIKAQERLEFSTYNRGSSVSKDHAHSNLNLARYLAKQMSVNPEWDSKDAQLLFEMLIPDRYKDFIRNYRNVSWRMDVNSASFPWEMFHDPNTGEEPTFVRSGMIRQLYSETATITPQLVRDEKALVIGNATFASEDLPDLVGTVEESKLITQLLEDKQFEVDSLLDQGALAIMKAFFTEPHRIIHIASHGLYDPGSDRDGIALGGNQFITPGTLSQLNRIPELVFINCCYSGFNDAKLEAHQKDRHKLAASIGTQLIELGVKAVVVAGWAVDDGAAKLFAEEFYKNILAGNYFGESILRARKKCYQKYQKTNTWGAYQAYGDPHFRIANASGGYASEDDLTLIQEIVMALNNLIAQAESISGNGKAEVDRLVNKVRALMSRAELLQLEGGYLLESEARFYSYVGEYKIALDRYERLFASDHGHYKVRSYLDSLEIKARHYASDSFAASGKKQRFSLIMNVIAKLDSLELNDPGSGSRKPKGQTVATILGSAYKRAASVSPNRKTVLKHLLDSADSYLTAAKQLGVETPSAIYQVCGFLTLSSFHNCSLRSNAKARIKYNEQLSMTPEAYYGLWEDPKSYEDQERDSAYAQLRGANLALSELVYDTLKPGGIKRSEINERTEALILKHDKQLSDSFNLRDLHGQIEHLDVLVRLCEEFEGTNGVSDLKSAIQRMRVMLRKHIE